MHINFSVIRLWAYRVGGSGGWNLSRKILHQFSIFYVLNKQWPFGWNSKSPQLSGLLWTKASAINFHSGVLAHLGKNCMCVCMQACRGCGGKEMIRGKGTWTLPPPSPGLDNVVCTKISSISRGGEGGVDSTNPDYVPVLNPPPSSQTKVQIYSAFSEKKMCLCLG